MLQTEGFDLSRENEVTHLFTTLHSWVEFRKFLEQQGFAVSERSDVPGLEARRSEIITVARMQSLVDDLCRRADKYAADYDGWDVGERLNRMGAAR